MFKNFPPDLFPHLFSFFSLREIYCNLQFVNKEWMTIANVPNLYRKRMRTIQQQGKRNDNHQTWTSYLISSFRNGKQFSEFNKISSDDSGNPILIPMWDDLHTQLIFSCIDRQKLSGNDLEIGTFVKTTGVDEMIKSVKFLYLVYYDKELVKRIVTDGSSIDSCVYGECDQFATAYQDRITDKFKKFMDLCYLDSSFKDVSDELFIYKILERVFALDLDNDWSKVFPCIGKCTLLKQKMSEESNREIIRKMFHLELEVALQMLLSILSLGLRVSDLDTLFSLAIYCKNTHSETELIVKLSESIINELNRRVLSEVEELKPMLDDDITFIPPKNKYIDMFAQNNGLLDMFDYRTLYNNTSFFLDYLYRNFSMKDMIRATKKRDKLMYAQNRLNDYFVFCIMNNKDVEMRAKFLEKLEQAFVYSTELKDFRTAFFFMYILLNANVFRLKKTHEAVSRPTTFKNLLEESQSVSSSERNYRRLYQTIETHADEANVPINIPLTNLVFINDGNSQQSFILIASYNIFLQFGRSLRVPSKFGKLERELLEKKTIKIIDKKGIKQAISSLFEGGNETHQIKPDSQILEFFTFIVLHFQSVSDANMYKMSLECEPRRAK